MTTIKDTKNVSQLIDRLLPQATLNALKDVERMRLRDGVLTPDMCRLLSTAEIVAVLLNV